MTDDALDREIQFVSAFVAVGLAAILGFTAMAEGSGWTLVLALCAILAVVKIVTMPTKRARQR